MPTTDAATEPKCLYLIDAMALAYRAHYIFISRPLINSKGQNTSASYGFTNTLLKLIEEHGMDHLVVVFDAVGEGGTFRDDLYEDYKAHRDPPPDELLENLPYIKGIVEALDIPVFEVEGVEADDVIGTLATDAAEDGADVVIVSPDKDFQQLLSDRITIQKPSRRGEAFDPITAETFMDDYGFPPHRFVDLLALWGDSSDNVPGVPSIGEKTGTGYLQEYDGLEDLIAHADEVGGKRGQNLKEFADQARLSKRLVTIKTDVPDVELDWSLFKRTQPDGAALADLFRELEFQSLLERAEKDGLFGNGKVEAPAEETDPALEFDFGPYEEVLEYDEAAVDYGIVRTVDDLEALVEQLKDEDVLAFDTETSSTDQMIAALVGVSLSWAPHTARYIPTPLPDGTSMEAVLGHLASLLQSDALKVGQNLKYDIVILARHGLQVTGPLFDTMVAHYLLAPEESHDLDSIARKYLSYRMVPIETLIGEGKNQITMQDVPIDEVGPYACEDADITLRLADVLEDELDEEGLTEIATTMEFPLIYVLADMEQTGIRVDRDVLLEISEELQAKLDALEAEIFELAGETFNINSTQQLGAILFEKLELPVISKTSTGRPSTKESVLQELSTEHDLPGLVLDWRKIYKLKGTYVDSLPELIHPETGRIHTSFNQTITATGRLSSSNPNLQNIPVRTAMGREIRKAFVPRDGWTLLAADYEQIELRILASMSEDDNLKQDFAESKDIHTTTAARVFKIDPETVTRGQRGKAKEVNYGIPYGLSAWGLAQR
ncbi:MAG: DNA polymerase I, partial [Bacteroidetes bacterium]|nr:DNA polymerase I [Bacteroidota bacterium]